VTLSDEAFMAWGWRLPFLASVILIGVGLYMRLKISESPDFQELQRNKLLVRKPIRQVFKTSPGTMLLAMGTRFAETVGGYIIITFVLTYLANHAGIGKGLGQYGLMIAAAFALVATPLLAKLSDRIGRKPVYAFGAVGLGLFIFPYFMMLNTGSFPVVALVMVLSIGVFYSAMAATQPAMYSELFDPSVRVSGVVAIREVSAPIAGGIAPFIATALLINSNGLLIRTVSSGR
jgi:MHS family shikimate/dehydroshikimate transporter-like MFS transporter